MFWFFILLSSSITISESAIWKISPEKTASRNSTWCYPKGGEWNPELQKCVCYSNYFGNYCERVKNCEHGIPIGEKCLCSSGWKGDACNVRDCNYDILIANGTPCTSCLQQPRIPHSCRDASRYHNIQASHSNQFSYYLNVVLLLIIAVYLMVYIAIKQRQQVVTMHLQTNPMLAAEVEALLLAKRYDLPPCPRYEEAMLLSDPSQNHLNMMVVDETVEAEKESGDTEDLIRIVSLHV